MEKNRIPELVAANEPFPRFTRREVEADGGQTAVPVSRNYTIDPGSTERR